jgi:DNA invertase Pin-like site-specific DNA recombinase
MTLQSPKRQRCAIYTRKSTEHNLDLEFNSLDAQREACEAYIKSHAHEGWRLIADHFDDGGLSGASLNRPSLQRLLDEVRGGKNFAPFNRRDRFAGDVVSNNTTASAASTSGTLCATTST